MIMLKNGSLSVGNTSNRDLRRNNDSFLFVLFGIAAITAGLCVVVCAQFESHYFSNAVISRQLKGHVVQSSNINNGKNNVIAVINTPKCGTGGLTIGASRTLQCTLPAEPFPGVQLKDCQDGHVIRTHGYHGGMQVLQDVRLESMNQYTDPQQQDQCLIITAIRHPQTWLPSLFVEFNKDALCDIDESEILDQQKLTKQVIKMYRQWLKSYVDRVRWIIGDARPKLLQEFGTNLQTEMRNIELNGGYSLIDHPSTAFPSRNKRKQHPLHGCQLLFLRMEDNEKWPQILQSVVPAGTEFKYEKPKTRIDLCPSLSQTYNDLLQYELSYRDRRHFIGNGQNSHHILDYFNAYGYLTPPHKQAATVQ